MRCELAALCQCHHTLAPHHQDIMRKVKDRPNALSSGTTVGLLETFQNATEGLEKIQKNLEDYLETKRTGFPRWVWKHGGVEVWA